MDDQLDVMLWILLLQLPSDVKAQRAGAFCDDDDSELYRAVSSGAQLLDMGRLIKNDVNSVKHVGKWGIPVYTSTPLDHTQKMAILTGLTTRPKTIKNQLTLVYRWFIAVFFPQQIGQTHVSHVSMHRSIYSTPGPGRRCHAKILPRSGTRLDSHFLYHSMYQLVI